MESKPKNMKSSKTFNAYINPIRNDRVILNDAYNCGGYYYQPGYFPNTG